MEPTEEINKLYQLAMERDQALTSYKQYQNNIDRSSVLEFADKGIFGTIQEAYKKHEDLIIKVKTASESFFNSLPGGLQFGISVLNKPLFLGVAFERMQPTNQWYVLTAKPFRSTEETDGTVTINKYACDVIKMPAPQQ